MKSLTQCDRHRQPNPERFPNHQYKNWVVRFWNHDIEINDCFGNSHLWFGKARTEAEASRKARTSRGSHWNFRVHSITLQDEEAILIPDSIANQCKAEDIDELTKFIRASRLLSKSAIKSGPMTLTEYRAWRAVSQSQT